MVERTERQAMIIWEKKQEFLQRILDLLSHIPFIAAN